MVEYSSNESQISGVETAASSPLFVEAMQNMWDSSNDGYTLRKEGLIPAFGNFLAAKFPALSKEIMTHGNRVTLAHLCAVHVIHEIPRAELAEISHKIKHAATNEVRDELGQKYTVLVRNAMVSVLARWEADNLYPEQREALARFLE